MSSDSDEMEDVTSLTSHTTPVKIFKSPSSGRPQPVFLPEPKSFSTKKERGHVPIQPPPKPQAKTCPPVSRVFKRRLELTSAQKVTFVNQNETRRFESVQGTPLPSSKVYDSAKKVSYFEQAFAIEAKIGAGCFGNVYRVKSKEDGKLYAVKIARDVYRGEGDRATKLEEVRKHQVLLPHSNCVHFYQSWEEKGRFYQQFELCEGNLMELCETQHNISETLIWSYLVDLLLAVEHLHDHGLIHMDIKPENIFIGREGICKLGDFGLVIDLAKDDTKHSVEGDPRYLASEILESRKFTKAADIFSLGVTILELACDLDLPKYGPLWHKLREQGPDPALTAKLSPDLRRVIQLMMTKCPDRRLTVKQLLALPSVRKALAKRQRQLWVKESINVFTSLLFPFINAMLFLWSFFVVSPISRTKSVLSNWWRESRQSTPTNTNTVEINGMFASFSDEMEVMKSMDRRPPVSSTDRTANFYIGDMTINANHLSFSSDDEDIDCSTMNRNFDRSTSSSQYSGLARPITLNFSDEDDDFHDNTSENEQEGPTSTSDSFQYARNPAFSSPRNKSRNIYDNRSSEDMGQIDDSLDPCQREKLDNRSTPISSRVRYQNRISIEGNTPTASCRLGSRRNCNNSNTEYNTNHSSQKDSENDMIDNDRSGTPEVEQQCTPSSVRYRSHTKPSRSSTKRTYSSPKKKLNFDGMTDNAVDGSTIHDKSSHHGYLNLSSTPRKANSARIHKITFLE